MFSDHTEAQETIHVGRGLGACAMEERSSKSGMNRSQLSGAVRVMPRRAKLARPQGEVGDIICFQHAVLRTAKAWSHGQHTREDQREEASGVF